MEENIKEKAISSTIWKFAERILAQIVSLVVSIIIARILDPSDYSVVSIVTIFFSFANIIVSGGLNTALIQKKDASTDDYSSVLFFSIFLSIVVYCVLFFISPNIANLYNQPILVPIIRIMGLSLPVMAIKSIWCAYISSKLEFKKFFYSTIGGTVLSAAVGITMALKGFGAWALVAQQMTNIFSDTLILVLSTRIKVVMRLSLSSLKKLLNYGWKILASSLIGTIYAEVTPLIIGLKFNSADLSYYSKGKSFPSVLSTTATNTLSAVLFPVLAKNQDDKSKILSGTRLFMKLCSFIVFPVLLGFFVISRNFVIVLLTEKWVNSVFYIKLFCIVSMFDIVAIGNCETIKAIGRSDIYLIIDIIKKSLYFLIIFIFVFFSNNPEVLACSSLFCAFVQIAVNCIPNIKLIGYRLSSQIADLLPSLFCSLIMCIIVSLIGLLNFNLILLIVIQILIGVVLYFALSYIFNKKILKYSFSIVINFLRRKK